MSHDGIPHATPVSFVHHNGMILVATDYTVTCKYQAKPAHRHCDLHLQERKGHKAACIQGKAKPVEQGPEVGEFYGIFYEKFE